MSDSIEIRMAKVEKTVQEIDDIIFGKWDHQLTKRDPGLVEKIDAITTQTAWLVKAIKWGVGPLVTTATLMLAGPYAKELAVPLLKVVAELLSH